MQISRVWFSPFENTSISWHGDLIVQQSNSQDFPPLDETVIPYMSACCHRPGLDTDSTEIMTLLISITQNSSFDAFYFHYMLLQYLSCM